MTARNCEVKYIICYDNDILPRYVDIPWYYESSTMVCWKSSFCTILEYGLFYGNNIEILKLLRNSSDYYTYLFELCQIFE